MEILVCECWQLCCGHQSAAKSSRPSDSLCRHIAPMHTAKRNGGMAARTRRKVFPQGVPLRRAIHFSRRLLRNSGWSRVILWKSWEGAPREKQRTQRFQGITPVRAARHLVAQRISRSIKTSAARQCGVFQRSPRTGDSTMKTPSGRHQTLQAGAVLGVAIFVLA